MFPYTALHVPRFSFYKLCIYDINKYFMCYLFVFIKLNPNIFHLSIVDLIQGCVSDVNLYRLLGAYPRQDVAAQMSLQN